MAENSAEHERALMARPLEQIRARLQADPESEGKTTALEWIDGLLAQVSQAEVRSAEDVA
jgi:hypothetical protein